mgnify:CR=1 FL=1
MYNAELKNRFLEQYSNVKTRKTYSDSLSQINDMEELYDKDVFLFTYEELHEALNGIRTKTSSGAGRIISPIMKYIDFANEEGYVPSKITYTKLFKGKKLEEYISSYALNNSYIVRDELYDICSYLTNDMDKSILVMAFEGIDGREHFEMRNLKKQDINFSTGEVEVTNIDGEIRKITIEDKRSLDILEDTIKETEYKFSNGAELLRAKDDILENTPYLLRRVESKLSNTEIEDERVTSNFLSCKVTVFFKGKKVKKNIIADPPYVPNYQFLNITNVFKSGFFDYCTQLEQKKGIKLETKDYKTACERYGINPNNIPSYKKQYLDWKERINRKG